MHTRQLADVSKTGGEEYNRPDHKQSSASSAPDCKSACRTCVASPLTCYSIDEVDEDYTVKKASEQGSGESSLFSSALGFLKSNTVSRSTALSTDIQLIWESRTSKRIR